MVNQKCSILKRLHITQASALIAKWQKAETVWTQSHVMYKCSITMENHYICCMNVNLCSMADYTNFTLNGGGIVCRMIASNPVATDNSFTFKRSTTGVYLLIDIWPVSQRLWHAKELILLNGSEVLLFIKFGRTPSAMTSSLYEFIFKRN